MDHPFHHAPISVPPLLPYAFASNFHSFGANSSSSAGYTATDPFMDCRIWSRLPQRLVDRIIACLPPPAMFRARAVCKRWYALIFSTAFLELYLQASPRHHWFLFFKQQRLNNNHIYRSSSSSSDVNNSNRRSTAAADRHHHKSATNNYEIFLFDPENLKWYRLNPFPMIPPGFSPASSSGGLICWVSEGSGTKSIVLSNPLTGSLIQLPSTLRPRLCPSLGLTITNTSIDVVLAGDDLISPYAVKNLTSESFHIHGNGFYSIWGTTASLPRLCSFESGRMVHVGANGGSKFYCMNYSPFSVLSYDVATNQWSKIQAPMRRFLRSPSLVESRGRLVLVAAVEKSKLNVPRSLRLWALQDCGTTWAEIERMPQQLYAQFVEVEGGRGFECVAHGEYVVMLVKGSVEALLFDFCRKRWVWIPSCPYVMSRGCSGGSSSCGDEDDQELHGFAYEAKVAVPITALLEQLAVPFMNSFSTA
uniref:Unusual floral organs-like protein n=1 Tax=Torenia fournieri TaxID=68875 RepID=G3XFW7_9LAMI|nr:unusual floral organs-like protein [Torenia fournieri]